MTTEEGGTYLSQVPAVNGMHRDGRCVWRTAPFRLSCHKTDITGLQADPTTLRLLQQYGAVAGLPGTVEAKQQPVDAVPAISGRAAVDATVARASSTDLNVATGGQPVSGNARLPGIKVSETTKQRACCALI